MLAVFEFVDHELGDVGAADGVADGDRQAGLGSQPPGGGPVGQPGWPHNGPVQVAGGHARAFVAGGLAAVDCKISPVIHGDDSGGKTALTTSLIWPNLGCNCRDRRS